MNPHVEDSRTTRLVIYYGVAENADGLNSKSEIGYVGLDVHKDTIAVAVAE